MPNHGLARTRGVVHAKNLRLRSCPPGVARRAGAATTSVGVVVPAHNEQDLLPRCLAALAVAAANIAQPVHLVVVLDACHDASAAIARAAAPAFASLRTVEIASRNVGSARHAGFHHLGTRRRAPGPSWLATTDADSAVPPAWFVRQLAHRAAGADAVAGTVAVDDWTGYPPATAARYLASYHAADGHRHVHGANLSFSAAAYALVGGFRQMSVDEDVQLVADLVAAGQRVTWAGDQAVTTSARLVGRAPRGFAAHLAGLP